MRKAFLISIFVHGAFILIVGFIVCPWLDSRTKALFGAVDVDVLVVADRAGTGEQKTPKAQESKPRSLPQADPIPIPIPGPSTDHRAPVTESGSAVDQVAFSDGDGNAMSVTTAGYTKWVREHNAAPTYPRAARIHGEQGRVIVRVVVLRGGSPAQAITVEESSNSQLLDQAALEAVRSWRFPAFQSAKAQVVVRVPFKFSLTD